MQRANGLKVKKKLTVSEENACSILITCKKANNGKMSVELTYEGDPVLANYLLENAQGAIGYEDDLL